MARFFKFFSFLAIMLFLFSSFGCQVPDSPLPTEAPLLASPSQEAVFSPQSTNAASLSLFIGIKEDASSLDGILIDEYKNAQSKCDSLGTYAFKLENGSLFTVLISSGNLASDTDIGYALIKQTSDNAFLALWRINADYTVSVSGNNVTFDEMNAFLNAFCV